MKENKDLWYEIENELGKVTDFKIIELGGASEKGNELMEPFYKMTYKSNGIAKVIDFKYPKMLIRSFLFCMAKFDPQRPIQKPKNTMERYAILRATKFAEWAAENSYEMLTGTFAWESPFDNKQYSTEELYTKYIQRWITTPV